MRLALLLVAVGACGNVKEQHQPADAQIDAPSCGPSDQVDSCGASCEVCTAVGARLVPTCDGTACGTACGGGAPTCTDNSCSQLVFDFEDGTTEGLVTTVGTALSVATHNGSKAVAIPVVWTPTSQAPIFVNVPICLSSAIDLSARALSVSIFYDDPNAATGVQYYTEAWTPTKGTVAATFVGMASIEANKPQSLSGAMSTATSSASTPSLQFEIGSFGASFSGTVWIDDITVH